MLRVLPLALVVLLLAAAGAQASTVKVAAPAEGQVAVTVASVPKKAKLKVSAPAALAVSGAAKKGKLAVAVIRPRGSAGGDVKLTIKGGKAKSIRRYGAALGGDSAPGSVCRTLALLGSSLKTGGLAAADVKTVGQAAAAKLCGRPLPAAAPGVLAKLGLGSSPQGGIGQPGAGLGSPKPPPPPAPGDGTTNECSNGIDDDGDGQADAPSERKPRPDPGCMNANDRSENSEVPLNCNAGAGVGDDKSVLQIGVNDGCGSFVELAVYAAPNAFVCDIQASAGNWICVIAHGHAYADTRNAIDADAADLQIGLVADADCTVPVTIVLTRRNFEVAELVTPIARCGEAAAACSNGVDDDDDGMADAREFGQDPDPGCSGPADTSEDSETGLPAGCSIGGGPVGGDPRFPGVQTSGCGSLKGIWFKPSAMPSDCAFAIGAGAGQACTVTGSTVGAAFAATGSDVIIGGHTQTDPSCGPVTVALTLGDGRVAALRDNWC